MALVKVLRSRGSIITVEAHTEVLFTEGALLSRWSREFKTAIQTAAEAAAPTNKRPRWGHYGKPLKDSFDSKVRSNPAQHRVDFAIGNSANHALFVDQGTKAFEAKILPPWTRGGASLYEHTWRPGPNSRPIGTITVSGQRAQHFMDRGIKEGFAAMRLADAVIPGKHPGLRTFPDHLSTFVGATPANSAFIKSLEQWRAWRDKAFNSGRLLGGRQGNTKERARRAKIKAENKRKRKERAKARRAESTAKSAAERGRAYRERMAASKGKSKPARRTKDDAAKKRQTAAQKADKANFKAAMIRKYGRIVGAVERQGDYWVATVPTKDSRGRNIFKVVKAKAKS